ncbi:MAG: hypothetical protein PHV82_14600 [Victivallaceae bacterium]|nr:hypothetical protein [Victivallaceae bacterium]
MAGKLFLGILIMTALVFGVNAEPTHGWYGKPITLDWSSGGPNVRVNETIGLTVTQLYSENYSAFGYFTYNPFTGSILEQQAVTFDDTGSAYIGQFEAGTYVGTWLTTDVGTSYSVSSLNAWGMQRATYLGDTAEGNMVVGLEGDPIWQGTDYTEMVVAIEPTENAPAGQPLPGVIISALIGLGVAGAAGVKKNKKIV